MAKTNQLTIVRGTSFDFNFTFSQDGVPNLVGAIVYLTVKTSPSDSIADDSSAIIQKTVTQHTDPEAGLTVISLTDNDTEIPVGKGYYWDIKVKTVGGKTYSCVEGKLEISPAVTNRNVSA